MPQMPHCAIESTARQGVDSRGCTVETKINFHTTTPRGGTRRPARRHSLSKCPKTGLARFRDRHQARDGARALAAGPRQFDVNTFSCPDCKGWHVEKNEVRNPFAVTASADPQDSFTASLGSRKRRFFLLDIENPTRGARATRDEVASLWALLKAKAPGIAPRDHVVVGASRSVARKYRSTIHGANVKWVVGANAPDAADRALLGAIDLYRVARNYDELVIVSGDHAFAELARRAKTFGLSVCVVTAEHRGQRTMLSRELAVAADTRAVIRCRDRFSPLSTSHSSPEPTATWLASIERGTA